MQVEKRGIKNLNIRYRGKKGGMTLNAWSTKKKNEKYNEKVQKRGRMCAIWWQVTYARSKMVAGNFCREK